MRFSPHFLKLVHPDCLIFGTKVNLDHIYTLAIMKLFGKKLSPLIPLNPIKKASKLGVFPLFFRLVERNCLIFETKVNVGNIYTFAILKLFQFFLIPSNPINPLKKA